MNATHTAIWPVLTYDDARSAMRFLIEAFGFEQGEVHAEEGDDSRIVHAVLRWPAGGGVMLGSTGVGDEPFSSLPKSPASLYIVTEEPDALFERATAAGADVARGLRDEDYGSRGFTVRDPEGGLWSFGTYVGE